MFGRDYYHTMFRFLVVGLACVLFSSALAGEFQDHWAFQPLQEVCVPAIDDAWIQTPVDAFILERLRAQNLSPERPSSRRDCIRRVYVALTGLPPAYNDVEIWLHDSATADDVFVNQLVGRLLASPQFGVRWGRYWLDVARYSDTKGYAYGVEQPDFFHAWPYRDWVVEAFNADLPYDQFVERQIAADRLLAEGRCEPRDLAAMGFLTLGRRFLGVEQDIIDDRIDVVARGLLGLTAACARCHDHKFDPIPAADYYALYGIFKSSRERLVSLNRQPVEDPELATLQKALDTVFHKEADAAEKTFLERIDEYLIASLDLSKVPRPAFTEIVLPDAVNPAQIRRWHEYLAQSDKEQHSVFAPWKALAAAAPANFSPILESLARQSRINPLVLRRLAETQPSSMEDVAMLYAAIFKEAAAESHSGTAWDEIRTVMRAPDSPFFIPRNHPHDVEWLFHNSALTAVKGAFANVERRIVTLREQATYTVMLEDRPVPQNMRILLRGDYCTQGDEAPRAGLTLLGGDWDINDGSGRLELARSITDPANPLTARVIVNRIWHDYFGTGLVKTTSDFGLRADPPSHPALLDYLARQLIENDWSLKSIHRLIATSAVFQQRASVPGTADPENRLLSHFPRRRLDFESMRDALLVASGEMDLRMSGVPGPLLGANPSPRRSIFGKIDRKFLPTALRVFDFANPELHSPGRYETNVPQQALFFLNSPFTIQRAKALVRSIAKGSPESRVRQMFQTVYQRDPTAEQLAASLDFLRTPHHAGDVTQTWETSREFAGDIDQPDPLTPWERLAQALMLSNEFLFVD